MASRSAGATDVVAKVQAHNKGREPERLAMKYAKMAQTPFIFLRGACHLFYEALPKAGAFKSAPLAWCCGDLHFENYGSYKGDNRLVYFDVNDFDEAALAPATWDIVRLLTSLMSGADAMRTTRAEALAVSRSCIDAYRAGVVGGKPLWVEEETSIGLVSALLKNLHLRERPSFLDKRTVRKGRHRALKADGIKALPASEDQRRRVTDFMVRFAATQPDPRFYEVLDVARRIAGTGSLGVDRFVVLAEGKGSPDGNYFIDIKEAKPSAMVPHLERLGIRQPAWKTESARVVTVQKRMQAVDHAFLQAVELDGKPCILKGLQPSEDRVAIGEWGKNLDRLKEVGDTMARVLAWDQLRASGRSGSSTADELIAFAGKDQWFAEVLDAAVQMTRTTQEQWEVFSEAHRRGELGAKPR